VAPQNDDNVHSPLAQCREENGDCSKRTVAELPFLLWQYALSINNTNTIIIIIIIIITSQRIIIDTWASTIYNTIKNQGKYIHSTSYAVSVYSITRINCGFLLYDSWLEIVPDYRDGLRCQVPDNEVKSDKERQCHIENALLVDDSKSGNSNQST